MGTKRIADQRDVTKYFFVVTVIHRTRRTVFRTWTCGFIKGLNRIIRESHKKSNLRT